VFIGGSLLDERRSRARLLRDRLTAVQKAAEREPAEELAILRDEMLSEIPALDTLLRKSARVSLLQKLLSQADIEIRAVNYLLLSALSATVLAVVVILWSKMPVLGWSGVLLGFRSEERRVG